MTPDPLLDRYSGPPDILTFLAARYGQHLKDLNGRLAKESGQDPPQLSLDELLEPVEPFLAFAKGYLNQHRPASLFHPDGNFGIKLTNGETLVISPPLTQVRGAMQPSRSVIVTGQETLQEFLHGPESRPPQKTQAQDFMAGKTDLQDLTIRQPQRRMDQ